MKFDFAIGNPPYQADIANEGDRANPVYDKFMDAAYDVAECVELIHPARFLFNAGQTPKAWNKKMLNDEHFKVLSYEPDASKVFSNTEIKGGVAITFRNGKKVFGSIGTFTSFPELNTIIKKVDSVEENRPRLNSIIASQGLFRFSSEFVKDFPNAIDRTKGTGAKITSSAMDRLPRVFLSNQKAGNETYIRFLGRLSGRREYKYILKQYLVDNEYTEKYKLFIPEANNTGTFGETLTDPIIGYPMEGSADTYLNAGPFNTELEASNLSKYMKTKLFRALLGIKKVTQHCPPIVWSMIPLQDFTDRSDINWNTSIENINKQLYKKYNLNNEEITFVESHVKEME